MRCNAMQCDALLCCAVLPSVLSRRAGVCLFLPPSTHHPQSPRAKAASRSTREPRPTEMPDLPRISPASTPLRRGARCLRALTLRLRDRAMQGCQVQRCRCVPFVRGEERSDGRTRLLLLDSLALLCFALLWRICIRHRETYATPLLLLPRDSTGEGDVIMGGLMVGRLVRRMC